MFEDTLGKFVLVIALFAVFVVLGNIFAAGRHVAAERASSLRRRGRRSRARRLPVEPSAPAMGQEVMDVEEDGSDGEAQPSLARRMLPQLALSLVALAVAALALVVMWRVALQGG